MRDLPFPRFAGLLLLGSAAALAACGDDGSTSSGNGGSGGTGAATSTGGSGGSGGTAAAGGTGGTAGAGGTTTSSTDTSTALCPPDPAGPAPALKLTKIASGFDLPVYLTHAPGDAARLFVVEQTGRIQVIVDGAVLPEPFLDISAVVHPVEFAGDERGLLGLAFHPKYAENGRFFVHYTDASLEGGVIVELHATPGSDKADPAPAKTLYTVTKQQYGNHNGGQLAFGPDGYLYIGLGDGGLSHDPDENGEDTSSELGKILRVDPDTFPAPVAGNLQGGYPHIWDWGLRNPWRFSFDRCNGDLYIGDVGQGSWEEIDVEPAGQGLKNYGWDITEGNHCHEPELDCDMTGITPAVAEYSHQDGSGCSVTGGYVYRGSKIPNLVGTYFYGDYCTKRVWTFQYQSGAAANAKQLTQDLQTTTLQSISSFGEDANGELYIVDHAGDVYLIEAE